MKRESKKLLALLGKGKEKAQSVPALADALGMTVRQVSALANELRLNNYNVIGDGSGLYVAKNDEEIKNFVMSQHNRAISSFKSIRSMRAYLKSKGELPKGF